MPEGLVVLVLDRIHELPDQVQPQATRPALVDRQLDVHIRRRRDIERLDVIIGQRHLYAACDAGDLDPHVGVAPSAVLDHVRKQFLDRQIDDRQQPGIDSLAGEYLRSEGDDRRQGIETTPEPPVRRHGRGFRSCKAIEAIRRWCYNGAFSIVA